MIQSKRVWIIVGQPNSGKSSVIRALTGIRNADIYQISETIKPQPNTNTFYAFIIPSALQELYRLIPSDYINFIENKVIPANLKGNNRGLNYIKSKWHNNINDLVLCLHPNNKNVGYDAKDYINAFIQVGWNIQPIIYLDIQNPPIITGTINHTVTARRNNPQISSNHTANAIRKIWNWL